MGRLGVQVYDSALLKDIERGPGLFSQPPGLGGRPFQRRAGVGQIGVNGINLKTAVEDSVFGPTDQNPRSVLP
jgi:hypothetical protein